MTSPGISALAAGAAALIVSAAACGCGPATTTPSPATGTQATATVTVTRGSFLRTLRVAGITEAVRSAALPAPRLAGQGSPTLVITRLVKSGSQVKAGDVLVEFDPQDQIRAAFDRLTDFQEMEQQIRRVEAEQAAQYAGDETAMTRAQNDVGRAELEVRKNRVLPAIEAEKNDLALEETQARLDRGPRGASAPPADRRGGHADPADPPGAPRTGAPARRAERRVHGRQGAVRGHRDRAAGLQGLRDDRDPGRRRGPSRHADRQRRGSRLHAGARPGQPGGRRPRGRRPARPR